MKMKRYGHKTSSMEMFRGEPNGQRQRREASKTWLFVAGCGEGGFVSLGSMTAMVYSVIPGIHK